MKCDEVGLLLSPYLDGELTADQQEAVSIHLRECRACFVAWEKMCRISKMVQKIEVPMVSPLLPGRITAYVAGTNNDTAFLLSYASYLMLPVALSMILLSPVGALLVTVLRIAARNIGALIIIFSKIPAGGAALVWIGALLFTSGLLVYGIHRLMIIDIPAERGDMGL